jgi:Tfp pilus assembly PilM family ATPase
MNLLASWLASPPPDAAIEIAPGYVSAATMTSRRSGLAIQSYAVEALAENAVSASLTSPNVANRAAVVSGLRSVIGRLSSRPARVALVIPDISAKVSVVRFEHVPARRDDLDQLVRWQVRKAAPFSIDDASVTFSPGLRREDGSAEFIVVMARQDVIKGYEDVCAEVGLHAGLVDIATFAVVNLTLASAGRALQGDWLVVHRRPEYTSIAIVRSGDLIFFRSRPEDDEESLADVVHQTAMYYQDRLDGQGFARVLIAGSSGTGSAVDHLHHSLEERLGTPVESIDPTTAAALSDRITAPAQTMDILSPLTGILLRTRLQVASV